MKSKRPLTSFAPYEIRRFILPLTFAIIAILIGITVDHIINEPRQNFALLAFTTIAIFYASANSRMVARTANYNENYGRINAVVSGIGLGFLFYLLPERVEEVMHILIVLSAVAVATVSGRKLAYVNLLSTLAVSLPMEIKSIRNISGWMEYLVPFIISVIVCEVFFMIKNTAQQHIHRLETINKVSRQIMLTLDTEKTISLLDAAIRDALEADSYFVGIVRGDEIQMELFYDDGEYYSGLHVPFEGTLAGWVIKNQKELFLPDLRDEVQLAGVKRVVIGKEKTSLSWMGVPLIAPNVTGVFSLSSYSPNAFDLADMELLSNLAQHITLALDNTIRHAQVEEQARLDSMTGVYNHGYFLKKLGEQAQECAANQKPLSLIMLDIDYFKHYNDTFGHLLGDQILNALCTCIKQHIKQADTVGRWGGEEFVISLPGATGEQANQIANRVSTTMASLRVEDREQHTVPVPTVSQGIAVFPDEADEIYRLIDLADRRLYVAKNRGRNQIEPDAAHWQNEMSRS
jgi:diguanylate cyclase (GGDEF)-like protein